MEGKLLLGIIVLSLMTIIYSYVVYKCLRVKAWPSCEGVILKSEVGLGISGPKTEGYFPSIEYEYLVNGNKHLSTKVFAVDRSGSEKWAKNIVNQFPLGKCTLYYNRKDNSESVLINHVSKFFLLAGLVFVGPWWGIITDLMAA